MLVSPLPPLGYSSRTFLVPRPSGESSVRRKVRDARLTLQLQKCKGDVQVSSAAFAQCRGGILAYTRGPIGFATIPLAGLDLMKLAVSLISRALHFSNFKNPGVFNFYFLCTLAINNEPRHFISRIFPRLLEE